MPTTIQISFIKDLGYEEEAPISNTNLTWSLKRADAGEVALSEAKQLSTDGGGNLWIRNIEMAEGETLTFAYTLLGRSKQIKIQHTPESKTGQNLVIKQYLGDVFIEISFFKNIVTIPKTETTAAQTYLPLTGETVTWKLKNGETLISEGNFPLNATNKLKVPLDEIPKEKLKFSYDICDQPVEVDVEAVNFKPKYARSTDEVSESNRQFHVLERIHHVSTAVQINHTGAAEAVTAIKSKKVSWEHKKIIVKPQPAKQESDQPSAVAQQPVAQPTEFGETIASGETTINEQGRLFVYDLRISKEVSALIYKIDGQPEMTVRLNRQIDNYPSPNPLVKSQPLSKTNTLEIKFFYDRAKSETINDEPFQLSLADVPQNNPKTDPTGMIRIPNVKVPPGGLKIRYKIKDVERSFNIRHDDKTEKGAPFQLNEYLVSTTVMIVYKSDQSTAGKPVAWKLYDQFAMKAESIEPARTDTDTDGILTLKNVHLLDGKTLKFNYVIMLGDKNVERTIAVQHDDKSKKGLPLIIIQYLSGIPIVVTFKEKKGKTPIAKKPIKWELKGGSVDRSSVDGAETEDDGTVKIENIVIPKEDLIFTYAILEESGSQTFSVNLFKAIEDEGQRKGIEKTIEIGREDKEVSITNPDRLWLTYETRFNWTTFSKTNQGLKLRLFRTEIKNLLVMLAPEIDLPDDELEPLKKIFFPKVPSIKELRKFGVVPWDDPRINFKTSPKTNVIDRDTARLFICQAVLPYNIRDNEVDSNAIGTKTTSRIQGYTLEPLEEKIDMWNTASRSSVVNIEKVTADFDQKVFKKESEDTMSLLWDKKDYGIRDPEFLEPFASKPEGEAGPLDLKQKGAAFYKNLISLKTGVNLIGYHKQGNMVGKDKLEHNSILAALRSAFIRSCEREFGYDSFADKNLLVLTEIMTVTEVDQANWDLWMFPPDDAPRKPANQPKFGDGYQIRSLKGMAHDKEYFPPISIPFAKIKDGKIDENSACEMSYQKTIKSELLGAFINDDLPYSLSVFEQVDDPQWKEFWKKHYAVPLGYTKARLLLRYGLQGFGGNAQNFLLEMNNGVPNGRVVVRDMGDYALHDFVLWALFGPGSGPAPDARKGSCGNQEEIVQAWKKAFSKMNLLHYECDVLHQYLDDEGKAKTSEFPTFTGYHRSNSSGMNTLNPFCEFCDNDGGAKFVGHISPLFSYAMPVSPLVFHKYNTKVGIENWAKVFAAETEWGISHAKAWINYLQLALNHDFKIDFTPEPIASFLEKEGWTASPKNESLAHRIYSPEAYIQAAALEDFGGKPWRSKDKFNDRADDLFLKFKTWEMYIGWQVENFLMSEEGQTAIRKYVRGGGWQQTESKIAELVPEKPAEIELTLAKFDQLEMGMNYQKVVQIIGGEGKDKSEESERRVNVFTYQWEAGASKTILVVLTNDKLVGKYKANLK